MKERGKDRPEKATYQAGDYGRMIRPDGTEQWWVRSPREFGLLYGTSGLCRMRMGASRCCHWRYELRSTAMALGLTIPRVDHVSNYCATTTARLEPLG